MRQALFGTDRRHPLPSRLPLPRFERGRFPPKRPLFRRRNVLFFGDSTRAMAEFGNYEDSVKFRAKRRTSIGYVADLKRSAHLQAHGNPIEGSYPTEVSDTGSILIFTTHPSPNIWCGRIFHDPREAVSGVVRVTWRVGLLFPSTPARKCFSSGRNNKHNVAAGTTQTWASFWFPWAMLFFCELSIYNRTPLKYVNMYDAAYCGDAKCDTPTYSSCNTWYKTNRIPFFLRVCTSTQHPPTLKNRKDRFVRT